MPDLKSRNWLKISCIGCVGTPCLVLMLTFGWIKCQVAKIGDKLPVELAKLRAMGVATEPEDLTPNPPVPASENALPIYDQIETERARIKALRRDNHEILSNYAGHPSDLASYEKALREDAKVFDLAKQLPSKRRLARNRDYSKGFDLPFPEFVQMKDLSKYMSSKTRYHLLKNELQEALECIDIQFTITDHLAEETTLIGSLVCIATGAIAHANLDVYLENIQDNGEMLAKTEAVLLRHQSMPSLRRALEGEFVLGRIGLRSLRSWREIEGFGYAEERDHWDRTIDRWTVEDPGVRRMFEAKLAEGYRQLFETYPKDETDWLAANRAMEQFDARIAADNSMENKANQALFPVFIQAGTAFAKAQAEKKVALLAVKLLRMRPQGLPINLSSFSTLAIDPLSGKSMGYVRKGDGFKVWSIGGDLHDDGGRKRGRNVKTEDTDIVMGFRIGFPAIPPQPVRVIKGGPGGQMQRDYSIK